MRIICTVAEQYLLNDVELCVVFVTLASSYVNFCTFLKSNLLFRKDSFGLFKVCTTSN